MSLKFKGAGAEAFWGVPDAVYSGRVVNCSKVTDGEEEPLLTSTGETDGVVFLDDKDVLSIEVIYDSSFTPPDRGDAFTVASVSGYVQKVETLWEHRGWRKCRVNATNWQAMA